MSEPITPEVVARHGLTPDAYTRIQQQLGREPNLTEFGVFSAMWTERGPGVSSWAHLETLSSSGPRILQGPGQDVGVVDLGDGLAAAFKLERHHRTAAGAEAPGVNERGATEWAGHPTDTAPREEAAAGVGGALGGVLTVGARPVARLTALRLGDPAEPRTASLLEGVVAAAGGAGDAMGVPTVGGDVRFHPSYEGDGLVNVLTVGVLAADRFLRVTAAGAGDALMYLGARTGRDGLRGVTVAPAPVDRDRAVHVDGEGHPVLRHDPGALGADTSTGGKRPAIPVGAHSTGRRLLEACLELFEADAVVVIRGTGSTGLIGASVELARRGGNGLDLLLDQVPTREEAMTPDEVLRAQSPDRMVLVAAGGKEDAVRRICARWELDLAVIGKVTSSGRWRAEWHGQRLADLPVELITAGAPRSERPKKPHPAVAALGRFDATTLPPAVDLGVSLLGLLARPTLASKVWVHRLGDGAARPTGGPPPGRPRPGEAGVVPPGRDAALVRLAQSDPRHARKGIALSLAVNGRWCFLDPYLGAQHAVAECARHIACVGGDPVAISPCLNFGDLANPEIMWQLAEAVRGLGDACRVLGTPVVPGDVSPGHGAAGPGILPTPTVGMLGLVEPVDRTCQSAFLNAGDVVAVVGSLQGEVGGSEYLAAEFGEEAGRPPALDLARERAVQETVRRAIREGLLTSAHACSDGGLAAALAECCMGADAPGGGAAPFVGAVVRVPFPVRKDFVLFGEDASRIVVSLPNAGAQRLLDIARECGAPVIRLGVVGGDRLVIEGALDVPVAELAQARRDGLPSVLRGDTARRSASDAT